MNLFGTLNTASGALRAFQQKVATTQANINNVSTEGYARQETPLQALPFQPESGPQGGVEAGAQRSSRDLTAEANVRGQLAALSNYAQQTQTLSRIESLFDVSAESGVPAALNGFFDAFASFALAPNSVSARESALNAADSAALALNRAAASLAEIRRTVDTQIESTVEEINEIGGRIRAYNESILRTGGGDAGLEAQAFAAAEDLAELVDVQIFYQDDRTLKVLVGGQTTLVSGRELNELKVDFVAPDPGQNLGAPSTPRILSADGRNITSTISQGRLTGLLETRSGVLADLAGDAVQTGSLNELAQGFADRVNQILTGALIEEGPPAVAGTPLFTYDATRPTAIAATLAIDPAATPATLAAMNPGPPVVANGAALDIAALRISAAGADGIDGLSYLEYFGKIGELVGQQTQEVSASESRASLLVTRSRDLRHQISGVSLDREATELLQAQRSYEASAKIVQVVDELVQSVLSIVR